jgi:hypothetical protein
VVGVIGVASCATTLLFDFRESKAHHGVLHQLANPDDTDDSRICDLDDTDPEEWKRIKQIVKEKKKKRQKKMLEEDREHSSEQLLL